MKKWAAFILACALALGLSGCAGGAFKVGLVTENASADSSTYLGRIWQGVKEFGDDNGTAEVSKLGPNDGSVAENVAALSAKNYNLVWLATTNLDNTVIEQASQAMKGGTLGILGQGSINAPSNAFYTVYETQLPSCLAGYIAGYASTSKQIAMLGGVEGPQLTRYAAGYRYGAAIAAKELGVPINVTIAYTGTFTDNTVSTTKAAELYGAGNDVIFQVADQAGTGIISEAVREDKYVIGVDTDQAPLAPKHMLTSVVVDVAKGVEDVTERVSKGENLKGQTLSMGLEGDYVSIPEDNPLLTEKFPELYARAMNLKSQMESGELSVPTDMASADTAIAALK